MGWWHETCCLYELSVSSCMPFNNPFYFPFISPQICLLMCFRWPCFVWKFSKSNCLGRNVILIIFGRTNFLTHNSIEFQLCSACSFHQPTFLSWYLLQVLRQLTLCRYVLSSKWLHSWLDDWFDRVVSCWFWGIFIQVHSDMVGLVASG
jgi:hypothetical protein